MQPRAGGAIAMALVQRLEQRLSIEPRHQIAGQAADRAERRGAGIGSARAALVVVAVAYEPDPVAQAEGIVQQPLEGAPAGMHLDRALDAAVVADVEVGVAPADMGDHDRILAVQRLEQLARGVDVGAGVRSAAGCWTSAGSAGPRAGRRRCGRRPCRCCPTIRSRAPPPTRPACRYSCAKRLISAQNRPRSGNHCPGGRRCRRTPCRARRRSSRRRCWCRRSRSLWPCRSPQ